MYITLQNLGLIKIKTEKQYKKNKLLYNKKRKKVNKMQTLADKINQIDKLEAQREFLNLINQYNSTDRKIIKLNLKRILAEYEIKPKQIIELGYTSPNVYSWLAPTANNIPMFDQALHLSVAFDFDIEEFLKEI